MLGKLKINLECYINILQLMEMYTYQYSVVTNILENSSRKFI